MNDDLLTISQAAKYLGVSINTLRRWDNLEKLKSVRKGDGGHRYYRRFDLEILQSAIFSKGVAWVKAKIASEPSDDYYCPTSDVFNHRVHVLETLLGRIVALRERYPLITLIVGEIGNNSFDHNIGNWRDVPGVFFGYDLEKRQIALADRGRGVLKTLQRVRPELVSDEQALVVAFTEAISGRAPESRGNGLKTVRSVIGDNDFELYFQSGDTGVNLKKRAEDLNIKTASDRIEGCLALIKF